MKTLIRVFSLIIILVVLIPLSSLGGQGTKWEVQTDFQERLKSVRLPMVEADYSSKPLPADPKQGS